jgi:hypothetical protein
MKNKIFLSALMTLISVAIISAQPGPGNHRRHHQNQKERIENGRRNGDLTNREYVHLKQDHKRLKWAYRQAWSDGRLTKREKRELRALRCQMDDHIYREKHDRERRRNW